mgnify:CR=1 FL=1
MRMKIPLINIRNKIEAEAAGKFTKADIDVSQIYTSLPLSFKR